MRYLAGASELDTGGAAGFHKADEFERFQRAQSSLHWQD